MKAAFKTLALSCGASLVALSSAATAQNAAGSSADAADQAEATTVEDENTIIVTATRREQALIDTPSAIDVVSSEDIARYNLLDVKDIQNVAPGLQLQNTDGRSNVATLRGISFNPDSGSSDAVAVFFNEIDVDPNTFFAAIYDIGQIEVLRGPQGQFRGAVAPAGAILIGTARPDLYKPTGYIQGTGTDLEGYNVQGAASLPLVEGKLGLRVAMLVDGNRATHIRNVDGRESKSETMSARASLAWEPSDAFRADLVYQYLNIDSTPFRAVFGPGNQPSNNAFFPLRSGPAIGIEDRLATVEGATRFQTETHIVTLNTSYDLDFATFSFNAGYQNSALTQLRDQDAGNAVPGFELPQLVNTPYDLWTFEARLDSDPDSRLIWSISANHDISNFKDVTVNQRNDFLVTDPFGNIFPGMTGPGPVPPQIFSVPVDVQVILPIESRSYAIAGSLGYEIFDGFTIMAGLRQFWGKTTRNQTTIVPAFGLNTVTNSVVKPEALTGGASATWEINPDLTVYASYGRAFRPGVAATGVTVPLDPEFLITPDETSDGFELGLKTNLFDRKVSLNLAAFYQKFKNYVDFAPALTTNSSRIPGQVDSAVAPLPTFGDAISKGIEAQLTVRPVDWFDFGLNAAYADASYDNAQVYCNDYNGDGIADSIGTPRVPGTRQVALCTRNDRIAEVPRFNMTANSEVRFGSGDNVTPFVRGLLTYRPGYTSTNTNFNYRDFTKIDLFAGIRFPKQRIEATFFVKNALDQTRVLLASDGNFQQPTSSLPGLGGFGTRPFDSGYRLASITAPREFGLVLRLDW